MSRFQANPALLCVSAFALLAVAIYALPLATLFQAVLSPDLTPQITDRDFANYWMAGRLVLERAHWDLFTHDVYFMRLREMFGDDAEIRSWSYPPHFLLFLWPLGLLGYKAGLMIFLLSTFTLFAVAVALFRRAYAPQSDRTLLLLALAGYVLMMVLTTQNGFLTAAALLFGLTWMKKCPVLAGLAFACLTIKPQLGFLVPVLLLFDRNWRTIAWSAFFTLGLVALSIAVFGLDSWHAYLTETLAYQRSVMTDWYGIFLRMMPTAFGSMRTLGFSPDLALQVQLPISILAAALVIRVLWKETDPLRRVFAVACGTFLITPYAFNYDMGGLSAVAAILVGSDRVPESRPAVIAIAVVASIAAATTNLGRANLPIAPLVLAAGLLAVALKMHASSGSRRLEMR